MTNLTNKLDLEEVELDLYDEENDEDEEETYYFYDDENNFEKLKIQDMSGSGHELLKNYLIEVLRWFYRLEKWAVYGELNFYRTLNRMETPLYPDVALLKGQEWQYLQSYQIGITGPAPDLIIEVVSTNTRHKDLYRKPRRYARWGTPEYFVYDNRPRRRRKEGQRLWGWRLNEAGDYEALQPGTDGRMWSEQLECWLVPDNLYLRLYDKAGRPLLTAEEAKQELADLLEERAFRLAEQLRRLGYDPDQL